MRWSPIPISKRSIRANDDVALGAAQAVIAAGRGDKTIVTGMNGVPPALHAVKDGKIAMTVELNPFLWGRLRRRRAGELFEGRQGRVAGLHQARPGRQDQYRREAAEEAVRDIKWPVLRQRPRPSDFVAQLEAANLHPLWDRFRRITPIKPQAKDPPFLWRWRDIEPFSGARGSGSARSTMSNAAR